MHTRHILLAVALALLNACAVGPDYHRPSAPVPQKYKEAEGWKPAEPKEAASGTDWWSVYEDPTLDGLEKQVDVSNQTLKASEAAWRQAVALTDASWATLFPSLGVSASANRSGGGGGTQTFNQAGGTQTATVIKQSGARASNQFQVAGGISSWDLDIWGKIRRTIESNAASAQASAADLAAARLSAQTTLATDYVQLRVNDEQRQLLADTITGYARSLQITRNQYKVGIVALADVITAETALEGAQSQQIGLGVQRAQLEHAIATLIGKPAAEFSIPPAALTAVAPVVPTGIPSNLLERRPDIAEAERRMAATNAQIGVAVAAYFPSLTLNGSYGFASNVVSGLLQTPNSFWSIGANASETIFDFGARRAQVREARYAYEGTVATYRQTVLTAFQQVEDELAALRILEQQYEIADMTVKSANRAVELTLNQYKAGTVAYTAVITAQTIALNDAIGLSNIRQSRLVASIALIQALGGGWSADSLQPGKLPVPASALTH